MESDVYDDTWIKTAWGEGNPDSLIQSDDIQPRPRVQRAIELSCFEPGIHLLDIACGRGELPAIAADADIHAYGLDYSEAVLKVANRVRIHRKEQQKKDFNVIRSDATTLPFTDHSFDRVTMLDIIEHLTPEQLSNMFQEVYRVLKPTGFAVIHTLPNRWVYEIGYRIARFFLKKLPEQPRSEIEQKVHINEQSIPQLAATLNASGFNHHLWLEQHMASQARWQKNIAQTNYGDNRDTLYPALAGPKGTLLEGLSKTPLKLILSNDIFGILWKAESNPCEANLPTAFIEKCVTSYCTNR